MIDTGLDTMTEEGPCCLQNEIGNEVYGYLWNGLADIDLDKLLTFTNLMVGSTVSAVRPGARFGTRIEWVKGCFFEEKRNFKMGINGGFFVFEPGVFDFIQDDQVLLEREPLEAVIPGDLMAYRHEGFWQCMDPKRTIKFWKDLARRSKMVNLFFFWGL